MQEFNSTFEAAEGVTLTYKQALSTFVNHGFGALELCEALGWQMEYDAQDVYAELGY